MRKFHKVSMATFRIQALLAVSTLRASAFLPAQNPSWPPAWDMRSSTLGMVCNSSGYTNASFAAQLGIASFDWCVLLQAGTADSLLPVGAHLTALSSRRSNAKAQWAAAKPMDCEERLRTQAQMTHDASGGARRVFSYFNLVKALVRN